MPAWLTTVEPFLQHYGLAGLFAAVFLESFGMPLPGETMIILSATLAGAGQLSIAGVALTAFAAAVLGDNVGFLIGRFGGRPLIVRHGARIGITHQRMARVEAIIQRRGSVIVALARFVVLLRQLNGLAAGTAGMHWARFLAANAVGAALWVGLWTTLAYQFGSSLHLLPYLMRHLSWLAALIAPALLLAALAGWMFYRGNHRRIAPNQRRSLRMRPICRADPRSRDPIPNKETRMSYYMATTIEAPTIDEAVNIVTEALKTEGFGILTDIDIKATMKAKLDKDFRPYRILGACNPPLAHEALTAEDKIGTMLPCNVIVQEAEGGFEVAAVDPAASMSAVDNPALGSLAGKVRDKLSSVIKALG